MGVEVRMIIRERWELVDEFCTSHGLPFIHPQWAKVVGMVDDETGKLVGIAALQLVPHVEPIIIDEEYRGKGLWREAAEMLEGYLVATGVPGVYTQPVSDESKAMAKKVGFVECEHPLFVRKFGG